LGITLIMRVQHAEAVVQIHTKFQGLNATMLLLLQETAAATLGNTCYGRVEAATPIAGKWMLVWLHLFTHF